MKTMKYAAVILLIAGSLQVQIKAEETHDLQWMFDNKSTLSKDAQHTLDVLSKHGSAAGLTKLQVLDFSGNEITDIRPLEKLTNLKELYLYGNHITDINPLEKLTNLQVLGLDGNQITDISPLAKLTNLKWLYLYGNQITEKDLSPLAELKKLKTLYLDNNLVDVAKNYLPKTTSINPT